MIGRAAGVFLVVCAAANQAAAQTSPKLLVEPLHDAHLPCPANTDLAKALERRQIGTMIHADAGAKRALEARMILRNGGWRVILSEAPNPPLLDRDLPFSTCQDLADTAALIIERRLAEISWFGRAVDVSFPAPAQRSRLRGELSFGPGLRLAELQHPIGTLNLALHFPRPIRLGLWLQSERLVSESVIINGNNRGSLSTRELWAAATLGWCRKKARLDTCLGGAGGIVSISGRAQSRAPETLFQLHESRQTSPLFGVYGQISTAVGGGTFLAANLTATATIPSRSLAIEGTNVRRSVPPADAFFSLMLGWMTPKAP